MKNNAIKVVTFDLDDTLWAVKPVLLNAEQQVYAWLKQYAPAVTATFSLQQLMDIRLGIYQQRPDLCHQISQLRIVSLEHSLMEAGYQQQQASQLAEQAFDIFIDARHQVGLFDSVVPTLEKLHRDYRLGVLTNGNADVYRLAIGDYFDFAFSAEQLNASKPSANHFIAAQQFCNCRAEEIIHIGDHLEHDILAAQQAGCHSIWYNPDCRQTDPRIQIDRQIQCLSELPGAINNLKQPAQLRQ